MTCPQKIIRVDPNVDSIHLMKAAGSAKVSGGFLTWEMGGDSYLDGAYMVDRSYPPSHRSYPAEDRSYPLSYRSYPAEVRSKP